MMARILRIVNSVLTAYPLGSSNRDGLLLAQPFTYYLLYIRCGVLEPRGYAVRVISCRGETWCRQQPVDQTRINAIIRRIRTI